MVKKSSQQTEKPFTTTQFSTNSVAGIVLTGTEIKSIRKNAST